MSKTLLERAYTIRDEVSEAANSAYRVGQLLVDMLLQLQRVGGDYLSSVRDSVANGHITFEKGATVRGGLSVEDGASLKGGATFGDYVGGMLGGRGGKIDEHGNGELESLTIRSYLQTAELLINRITAIEGDWLMTESGTVEKVRYDGDRRYRLWLRRRWDGDFTAFAPQDVLKGVVNTLAARALGRTEGGDAVGGDGGVGKYATSWMLVRDVDLTENSIGVELYVDDVKVIPGGKNFAPVVGMNLARWGNVQNKTRQSCLYLSSREGRIVHLNHVDSPILSDSDVMSSFGSVPAFLQELLGDVLSKQEDYVFARGLIVQDIIRLGADSQPLAEVVDRGLWRSDASYYHKSRNMESGVWEISEVWHGGSKWRCMVGCVGVVPGAGSEWALLQAAPRDGDPGLNGKTSYLHIKYSNDNGRSFTSNDGETVGDYIGQCTDFNETAPRSPSAYKWSKVKGEQGERGQAGRDGLTPQANMLLGTDFKGAFGDREVPRKWYKHKTSAKLSDASKESTGSPVFGTGVVSIRSRDFSALDSSENVYNELVQKLEGVLTPGKEYIFSVYARRIRRTDCKFWLVSNGLTSHSETAFVAGGDWQRYSVSFVASDYSLAFSLRLWKKNGVDPGGWGVLFAAPKLEEGSVATPWCLAEEDKKGERGGMLRPRGLWSELKDGVQFESGGESDFVDVVTVGAGGGLETYYCTERHTKSADKKPSANSGYWRKGDSFELVSTRYALIGDATVDSAVVRQLRTAPEGHDRVVSVGAEQRTYAAGNAYPSIVQGFRQEGDQRIAVLEFYDGKTGKLLYNLGPNGIFSALNKYGNRWTAAKVIYVGEPYTARVRDLLEWVEKGNLPDYRMPEMSRPEKGREGESMGMLEFGTGIWFEEGYTVLNNIGAGGEDSKLYNVSRRSTPLYENKFLKSGELQYGGKRLYMWTDLSLDTMNAENYAPADLFVGPDGFENGNAENLVPRDGWYLSRNQTAKNTGRRFWNGRLNKNMDLWSLEVVHIRGGVYDQSATIYFAREDGYPLYGDSSTAEYGRDYDGNAKSELI